MDVAGSNLLFDSASVLLRDNTKNSNIGSYGYRVESGTGTNPDWYTGCNVEIQNFGKLYEDASNISTSYSNELQIVNGAYVGTNANCNYSVGLYSPLTPPSYSYPNYSGVYTTGGTRYATFMWYITGPNVLNYAYFQINGNNFSTRTTNGFVNYINGVTLQYRLIGSSVYNTNGSLRYSNYPPVNGGRTSAWLDGNSRDLLSANHFFANFSGLTNAAGGVPSVTISGNTVNTNNINRIIRISENNATNVGYPPFNLYIRIGMPMSSNTFFSNVTLVSVV